MIQQFCKEGFIQFYKLLRKFTNALTGLNNYHGRKIGIWNLNLEVGICY